MKYSVISNINGVFKIEAEYDNNLQGALVFFHQKCATLWNAEDVTEAVVQIIDQTLNVVAGKSEIIMHPIIAPVEE